MSLRMYLREHAALYAYLVKWLAITTALGSVVGSAVALFLWSLERATVTRFEYPWLLFLLPLGGLGIGLMYHYFGRSVEGGNNLILDQIHEPNGGVPVRMAPLVLIGTVLTHLFGGSAGREGTAVQMGGSMAARIGTWLGLSTHDARILMMAGVAAGFGAVFGTPLAGAVFAMEVLAIGRMSYESLLPCLAASVIGDVTVRGWGIAHSHYYITSVISSAASSEALSVHSPLTLLLMTKVIIAAIAFGLAAVLFADLTHRLAARRLPRGHPRPRAGNRRSSDNAPRQERAGPLGPRVAPDSDEPPRIAGRATPLQPLEGWRRGWGRALPRTHVTPLAGADGPLLPLPRDLRAHPELRAAWPRRTLSQPHTHCVGTFGRAAASEPRPSR